MEELKLAMVGISRGNKRRMVNNYPSYPPRPRMQGYNVTICNFCNKPGHSEQNCYRKKVCKICNRVGHTESICRELITRKEMNYINEEYYDPYN